MKRLLLIAAFAAGLALLGCEVSQPRRHEASVTPTVAALSAEQMQAGMQRFRLLYDSPDALQVRNAGCLSCHSTPGRPFMSETMHRSAQIACVDCHGGNPEPRWTGDVVDYQSPQRLSPEYLAVKKAAHAVEPRFPLAWTDPRTGEYSAANPVRSATLLNYEDPAFIRFVNPGDLRIAHVSCGQCHMAEVQKVRNSMMTHGAQLWAAVLYNNGSYPHKIARFGESYSFHGVSQRLYSVQAPPDDPRGFLRRHDPTPEERSRGVLAFLDPLPRWEIAQMGNILRAFERGGKVQRREVEIALPNIFEEPGKPDMKLSERGLGTELATDPVFLGIQKTRLLDPLLSMLGTNDHPGDYRSSGCSACHVVYANDRSPVHAGPYAEFGNRGTSHSGDPTIPPNRPGHPIRHELVTAIPSSQCVVCHIHPGTSFANSYYGFTWWDNETQGELMYPAQQRYPTAEQVFQTAMANPEGSAVRGLWSNNWPDQADHRGQVAGPDFLENMWERINARADKTQFADFHGHGWVFRAVFKQDRQGRLLNADGDVVDPVTPEQLQRSVAFLAAERGQKAPLDVPVHLKDIHLERGMHCVDCHFEQDAHGDGLLYGEVRNAIEIACIDCHGSVQKPAKFITSGPAGAPAGRSNDLRTKYGNTRYGPRFFRREGKWMQRSAVTPGLEWELPQVRDSVTRGSPAYNEKAARAKLMQRGPEGRWDDPDCPQSSLAHDADNMACSSCHTSWMTSCFGCHLPMRANMRMPMLHNEGRVLRNYTQYNYQVVRDDVFMLGRDSTVMGHKVVPVRSSSAVVVGSANSNREWIYSQQQTVSSEGYSGQAFNPHFPHAVRKTETRACTDCHVSSSGDNNAWMAQVLLHGTNYVNFLGRYVYVAMGRKGFEAVVVTERDEPQAVIGSSLHALAYPDHFRKHQEHHQELRESYEHAANIDGLIPTPGVEILDLQLRGEYLYTARGRGGFYAYDVANIDNKGFSERIVTAPVSPLGQSFHVPTRYATAVASPSTLAVDPLRTRVSADPHAPRKIGLDPPEAHHVNQEQAIAPVYGFIYVSDREEGLVVIGNPKTNTHWWVGRDTKLGVGTLLDGDPLNNFLTRTTAYNPEGKLSGAEHLTLAGNYAYICAESGLQIVDVSNPFEPRWVAEVGAPHILRPVAVAVQFRYAFVCDVDGLKVVDITDPAGPRVLPDAVVPLEDARRVYVARTYAYVAAGRQGLAIVDVTRPEHPVLDQLFNADGKIDDAYDVKVGMTNNSAFAYVADGRHGLRVVELVSPTHTPGFNGFSPRPTPRLIATYHEGGVARAISKGLDRDRAVDE
ncbi:MAG: hypothetical protein HUU27_04975, partial [Phycisphaerae bacterium]|nr:hypothetical protein [Phycisphaerae bacterium]